ncbi:MAG: GNAT family N-acetyltransferase [Spirosomataceae bacterium]
MLQIQPTRHIDQIQHLGYQTYLPHYPHLWHEGGAEWYLNRCFNESQLATELTNPAITYYAIYYQGQEVGLLKLVKYKTPSGELDDKALYLEKIYFSEGYTGMGLGQQTIQWVCEQAQQQGVEYIWLMAMDSSHKAIASYQKAGFVPIATTRLDDTDFRLMKSEYRGMVVLKRFSNF